MRKSSWLVGAVSAATLMIASPALAEEPSPPVAATPTDAVVTPIPVPLALAGPRIVFATALPEAEPPATAPPAKEAPTTVFGLPQNMGPVDRVFRGVVAAGLIGLASYGVASDDFAPATSGVLYGVSAVPLFTAITGYCPLYHALGVERSF